MMNDRRYVIVEFQLVTQEMIDACIQSSFDSLRHVRFNLDPRDLVVMKWRGQKPPELWLMFPVYSDQEMRDLLKDDLNRKK